MSFPPVSDSTARLLDRIVAQKQSQGKIPSIMAGAVRDGRLVWSKGRSGLSGFEPTAHTQYRIGSITKTFTAALVLRMRDEGLLGLNDPLERHLPGTPVGETTVGQLLSHTGGLGAEPPGPWWERSPGLDSTQLRDGLSAATQRYRPGQRHHYSNLGYGLLGEVIATARGAAWADVLQRELLAPLGLTRTSVAPSSPHAEGFAVHPHADVLLPEPAHDSKAMAPAGQLWSTAHDMGLWSAFLAGDGGDVLSGDTLAEMRRPQALADTPEWTAAWGLGVAVQRDGQRRMYGHGGSMPGFVAGLWVDEATSDAVTVLMNCTTPSGPGVTGQVLDVLDAHEPRDPRPWKPMNSVDSGLLELTGLWHWGPSTGVVRVLDDGWLQLEPLAGMLSQTRFRPDGADAWIGLDGYFAGEPLRVVRDGSGAVRHLNVCTFVLTRTPYESSGDANGGVEPGWPVT